MPNDKSAEEIVRGRIEAIKARCEAATPGPWEDNGNEIAAIDNPRVGIAGAISDSDNAFISHAREDIPYLLDLIKSQAAEIAAGKEANDSCHEYIKTLKAQLTASQQETRAAVEDIVVAHDMGRCSVCKHKVVEAGASCKKWPDRSCFEWRGPQEESFISKTIDGVETAIILRHGHREVHRGKE